MSASTSCGGAAARRMATPRATRGAVAASAAPAKQRVGGAATAGKVERGGQGGAWVTRGHVLPRPAPGDGDDVAEAVAAQPLAALSAPGLAAAAALGAALALSLAVPGTADASEALSSDMLDTFKDFLDYIENSGSMGIFVFVLTVMLLEMVPLLPTQPITVSAGLIFGAAKGSALIIVGSTAAALGAFFISRGIGRRLAEKVVVMEASDHGPMQAKIVEVQKAVRQGGPWQQLTAVTLMRITPIVPFSAANYILGMTPVGVAPYFVATVFGAAFWSVLYCSLGAASRELLEGGMDLGELLEGISQQAGSYSAVALKVTAGVAAAGGVALAVRSALGAQDGGDGGGGDPPAPPPAPADSGKSACGAGGGGAPPPRGEGSPEARDKADTSALVTSRSEDA